jgi:chemotaxis protein histidine kinase CheA
MAMNQRQDDWRGQPIFDRRLYDLLDQQTGGMASIIAATFLTLLPERSAALIAALRSQDQTAVARVAHLCKSCAGSIGLLRLAGFCAAMERGSVGRIDAAEAAEQFDAALRCLDRVKLGGMSGDSNC